MQVLLLIENLHLGTVLEKLVTWKCIKHDTVFHSNAEAEFQVLA